MKKLIRYFTIAVLASLAFLTMPAAQAYAYISEPDSTPTVESINCFRNVLETGDWAIFVYENTPYATTPTSMTYPQAFVWRLMDTDGTTELAQALGYPYNESGYGYNVIGFYLDASNVTALGITWGDSLYLTLSGTPAAFASPPEYTYAITAGDYSTYTATADVKDAVTDLIILLATDLDNKWGLLADEYLITESETATVLSLYGQSFFRGAMYGIQAMAPDAFPLTITSVVVTDRTWTTTYITTLEEQHSGTYIEEGITAGESFFDVDYNLAGILGTLAICLAIMFAHWYLSGGSIWKGLVEASPPLVIASRLAIFGLGELGLIAAICVLYWNAKMWKII